MNTYLPPFRTMLPAIYSSARNVSGKLMWWFKVSQKGLYNIDCAINGRQSVCISSICLDRQDFCRYDYYHAKNNNLRRRRDDCRAISSATVDDDGIRDNLTYSILLYILSKSIIDLPSKSSWCNLEVYFRLLSMNRNARPTFYLHENEWSFCHGLSREIHTLFRLERIYEFYERKETDPSISATLSAASRTVS